MRIGANGTSQAGIWRMYDTSSCVANIFSETMEIYEKHTTLSYGRRYHLVDGNTLDMHMTDDGLGWLQIKAITEPTSLRKLMAIVDMGTFERRETNGLLVLGGPERLVQCPELQPMLLFVRAYDVALSMASFDSVAVLTAFNPDTIRSGIGMGRAPAITGFELLQRMHVVLGHASIDDMIATLKLTRGIKAGIITAADVAEFKRQGCGVCETTKMKRRGFARNLKDHTLPLPGKVFTYDSLSMRTPTAEFKNMVLTAFVCKGSKKSFTFAHTQQTAEQYIGLALRLRAIVRPYHGEIWIGLSDSHSSFARSHEMKHFLVESQMQHSAGAPYKHEDATDVEILWHHGVPGAMALLLSGASTEAHFDTAFMTWERSHNTCAVRGTEPLASRDMIYYGRTSESHVYFLAYGAPVKALVHPEVRDSKYEDHAITGIYRGPSWTNNAETSCWISVGKGTIIRHVTVDIGCIRIDERQVVARISRTHPCHQPKAIGAATPVADPDLRDWVHPAFQSRNSSFVWTTASAAPTRPFFIYYECLAC